ncbi:hypothetical protein [Amycolatopsis sp. NPDC004079]|uniref:hypothetical protein n=1 Tax=Amycolatopsis sp. NPDC004079 TaxID=3154549 RepID=UPI0033AF2813
MSTGTGEMTAQDLHDALERIPRSDRPHVKVRVVLYAEHKTFNVPVTRTSGPALGVDLNIVCQE